MRNNLHYILKDDHTIEAVDVLTWAKWYESNDRKVRRTEYTVHTTGETVVISTVFLGLDHSFTANGPPILFETMVFGGKLDQEMDRYATWDQAVQGHDIWVRRVAATEDSVEDWKPSTESGHSAD